jgi:hypothetical protein
MTAAFKLKSCCHGSVSRGRKMARNKTKHKTDPGKPKEKNI